MILLRNNIWISSDTHYGHKNICKGVSEWDWKSKPDSVRDFKTLSEMNDKIVNNINNVVAQNDTFIHVGDWSFGGMENISQFRSRIMCDNIILIPGNHDHHIKKDKNDLKKLFSHVENLAEIEIFKKTFIFCHFPQTTWLDMKKGSYMLHGHIHSMNEKRFGEGRIMDVGMDGHPMFRPYHIDEIFSLLKDRKITEDKRHDNID